MCTKNVSLCVLDILPYHNRNCTSIYVFGKPGSQYKGYATWEAAYKDYQNTKADNHVIVILSIN